MSRAQTRVNTHGCTQPSLLNLQQWRLCNPYKQPVLLLHCPHGKFDCTEPPFFQRIPAVSSCSHAPLFKAWLLGNILSGIGKLLLGFPKAFVSAGWTNPVPWAFPQKISGPTPGASWWLSLSSHYFIDVLGGPELNTLFQTWSSEHSAERVNLQHKIKPAL